MERMSLNLIQCCRIRLNYGRGDSSGLRNELHFYRLANIISPGELSWILTYVELCVFVGIELEEAIRLLQVALQIHLPSCPTVFVYISVV